MNVVVESHTEWDRDRNVYQIDHVHEVYEGAPLRGTSEIHVTITVLHIFFVV